MVSVPVVIAVDVGGTTISAGVVSSAGEVLIARQVATHDAPGRAEAAIETLIDELEHAARARGHEVAGIGVGVPGPVDTTTGRISEHVPHVPELAGRPLAAALAARFRLPAFVDNDVNALALGEWMFGAGRGATSLVVLAPGTGFGTGIIIDGRLVRGAHGFGGELGHAPVKFDGPPCWCGGRGCLALYASGRGIADAARGRVAGDPDAALLRAAGGDAAAITAALVFRLADEGDVTAAALVDEACQALGAMIGVVVNGLNPEVIVITGGVAAAFLPREKRVLRAAADYAFAAALARTRVSIVLADKATTMRGAGALVLHEMERKDRS
ncbi:MAG TPA: ROK family protein [Methylomirabilota bacterium]|jgi:glucokinase